MRAGHLRSRPVSVRKWRVGQGEYEIPHQDRDTGANDVASMRERCGVSSRNAWRKPALLLIDGDCPR